MKRITILALACAVLVLAAAPRLSAQTDLSMNFGAVTDKSFSFNPFLWTAGMVIDIYLGPHVSLSPEGFIMVHNFDFGGFFVAPAVLLNYQGGGFFVGGGLTKWWLAGSDVGGSYSSDVGMKMNLGYKGSNLKLTVFAVTAFSEFMKEPVLGATFGFVF
jgi:hypothetical protein